MSFSPTQIRKLQQNLDPDCIRILEETRRRFLEANKANVEAQTRG